MLAGYSACPTRHLSGFRGPVCCLGTYRVTVLVALPVVEPAVVFDTVAAMFDTVAVVIDAAVVIDTVFVDFGLQRESL